jgi:ABC-type transport system involved in multi-copper enzyme maturation permease subunit
MTGTLVTAFLRQRFTSPMRAVLLLVVAGGPLFPVMFAPATGFSMLGGGSLLALILGGGMIGQDVSAGTLPLLLARPVSRTRYVVARWLGVILGAWLIVALQGLCAASIMLARGAAVPWRDGALFLANGAFEVIGMASLLAVLSALMNGLGDLGLLLLLFMSRQALGMVAQVRSSAPLLRAAEELGRLIGPKLELGPFFGPAPVSWFEVVSYFSTVTLCLALAILIVNRRELSYASAGS